MADKQDSNYWRQQGDKLVRDSKSAGLPPTKKSEYFVGADRDTAQVGDSEVSMPRYSGDSLSDSKGHLTGSAMSQMMQKNRDAADSNQRSQKWKRYMEGQKLSGK